MGNSYYRVCKNLSDKGILLEEGTNLEKYTKGEAYVSVFKYNEEHKKQFEKTGTIAGITDVKGDILYFDFDNADVNVAKQETEIAVNSLKEYFPEETINISFTTGKGFHIAIHLDREITPEQAKFFARNMCGDLKSFDDVIYNPARIIRMENSVHPKTNLPKTRIQAAELGLSVEEITSIAEEGPYEYVKPIKASLTSRVKKLMVPPKKEKNVLEVDSEEIKVDYLSNPLSLSPWKLALSQGLFVEGTRNEALTILAATFKAKGMDKTQAYYGCKAAADLQSNKFNSDKIGKKEIYHAINNVYSLSWKGGSYSEDNFPNKLVQFFEENGIPRKELSDVAGSTENIGKSFKEFIKYAEKIDEHTMQFGIESLDRKLKARKGQLIGLLAGPGIGKTSFGITLLNNCSVEGNKCFFASYDMYKLNVVSKLLQRHTGLEEDEIFDCFKNKNVAKIKDFQKILQDNYSNVSFCFKSGQSIEELKKSIRLEESVNENKIDLVLVDYLELIQTDKSDPTASSAEAINGLREIANEGRVVVVLLQPNKMSSTPDQPLLTYNAAKGSSMIAQAVTAMLTCHRPGYSSESPQNDKFFSINCVKNRNGGLFQLDFHWEGSTQTIRDLDDKEKFYLKQLRDLKNELKEEDI